MCAFDLAAKFYNLIYQLPWGTIILFYIILMWNKFDNMLNLWRNGLAKGNSNREEINSREIYEDVLIALNDYRSGGSGWQRKFGLGDWIVMPSTRERNIRRRIDIVLIKFSQKDGMEIKRCLKYMCTWLVL